MSLGCVAPSLWSSPESFADPLNKNMGKRKCTSQRLMTAQPAYKNHAASDSF